MNNQISFFSVTRPYQQENIEHGHVSNSPSPTLCLDDFSAKVHSVPAFHVFFQVRAPGFVCINFGMLFVLKPL